MPFYIVWGKPLRSRDVTYLFSKGYVKAHKGLWMSRSNSLKVDLEPIIGYYSDSITILKTSRELQKPFISFEGNIYNLGSLILIAYDLPRSACIRKAVSRVLRRSPCFKLSPSIYLFPHLKYEKYEGTLLESPSNLIRRIIVYGGRVTCASRLILVYDYSAKRIIEEFLNSLDERVKNIYNHCLTLENDVALKDPKLLSELKMEVKTLKTLLKFYKSEIGLGLNDIYTKVYKASKILSSI
ncbi:hypothetical protein KEJ27_10090 [Candidatus Bathyarchaeota archaeon]|nr:hypothetical protein [Candidatus Bathyarchaeota archaeon]